MAPNKLVKPTRPVPRRSYTNPTTPSTPPPESDGAPIHPFQRAIAFNHSNPEVALPSRRIPGGSGQRMSMHTYSPTHVSRSDAVPSQLVETHAVEGGWQFVRVLRVDPSIRTPDKSVATSSATTLTTSSSSPLKETRQPSFVKIEGITIGPHDPPERVSQAEAMFNPSKKGWRALTNTVDDTSSQNNKVCPGTRARQKLGIPSGTCFVEHLPECQWVAIGGPGSEAVDTRGLESLKWIAPAVTTS